MMFMQSSVQGFLSPVLVIVMVPFSYWSVLWNSRTFHAHVPVPVVLSKLLACVFHPACWSSVSNL